MILIELSNKCDDILLPLSYLTKSFESGLFPHSWLRSCIVPLFKKNDLKDA